MRNEAELLGGAQGDAHPEPGVRGLPLRHKYPDTGKLCRAGLWVTRELFTSLGQAAGTLEQQ